MADPALEWLSDPGGIVSMPNDAIAVDEAYALAQERSRAGNFFNSALNVLQHVERSEGISGSQRVRVQDLLRAQEDHLEHELANVRALLSTLLESREKYVADTDPLDPWNFSRCLALQFGASEGAEANEVTSYWRGVRDDLAAWFALPLDTLSGILGVAYATFANLGKRRPQGRTVRPILALHSLAKACIDTQGDTARAWLVAEGANLLQTQGMAAFEAAANKRLFSKAESSRVAISLKEEPEAFVGWRTTEVSDAHAERF